MGNACCGERERGEAGAKLIPFDKDTYVPPSASEQETLQTLCEVAEDEGKDQRELKHLLDKPQFRECVNLQESTGFTPILYAALMCNVGKIQVLLDAKANIYVLEARGWSVLHLVAKSASRYGTEAIRIFLEAGAETIIDIQDKEGKTALHFAAEANNRAMVQELLNSGANLSIQTKDGKAAIDLTKDADIQRLLSPGRRSISVNSSTPLIPSSA